jgi:hypothetical protein
VFLQVFQMYVSRVSSVFKHIFANVVSGYFESRTSVASLSSPSAASPRCFLLSVPAGHLPHPPSPFDAGDVRDGADLM